MRVFVIIATQRASQIAAAIEEKALSKYDLKDDAWLVASSGTTRELAESLGIRGGQSGSGLVCLIDGYSGRLASDAWEWLRLHSVES
jgi:hypothetical protein